MEKKLFLPIEIKKRELPSRVYLSLIAAKKGYSSILGHKSRFLKFQHYCTNGNIIIKSLPKKDIEYLKNLKKKNNNIYYIHEEGLMSFDDHFTHRMINSNALNFVDKVFTWGKEQTNSMKKIFVRNDDYLLEVGNPRIDVLIQLKKFFQYEAESIKKKFGNFILVTTKYGKINFFPRDDKSFNFISNQIKKGYIRDKHSEDLGRRSVEHEKKNLNLYLVFLKKYSKLNKKLIILRPHPGENFEFWNKELKEYNNIKVIQDHQSTNSWILASEFLISNNCTTLLEAHLLGKKCINFIPFQDQKVEYEIPKIVSKNIRSIDEMIDLCNNFQDQSNFNDLNNRNKLNSYLSNIEYFNSSEKIIDVIDSNKNNIIIKNYSRFYNDALVFFRDIKRKLFNKDTFMKNLSNQKFANISISEVQDIIKNVDDLNKYNVTIYKSGLINIKLK